MSQRIALTVDYPERMRYCLDAWIGDFQTFRELAESNKVLWGDHVRVWADETYMRRKDEFITICEEVRWPDVISSVEPIESFTVAPFTVRRRIAKELRRLADDYSPTDPREEIRRLAEELESLVDQ